MIDSITIADYIRRLEFRVAELESLDKSLIDARELEGVSVSVGEPLVRRRIGSIPTARSYVKLGLFSRHPKSTDNKLFLDLSEVLMAPNKHKLRLAAREATRGAKVTLSKYERPMKAQAIFNDDSGAVTIATADGERHDFDSVSKAVAWCRANNVQAELA